ncbi:hypothetical protein V502_11292 [Pseudogymnoascus sp. VKM F-4520 (FW-2644)]|nr:hypothetical protein V502_11292 [Pseudogymnoascus sp. VKM F-4520 (FW-2644)]
MQLPTVSQTSMDLALQVEIGALELTTALQNLVTSLRDAATPAEPISNPTTAFDLTSPFSQPTTSSTEANSKVQEARRAVRAKTAEICSLLAEPADLLQQLAIQNQFVACLQWLGEFLVLACIPATGSVPIKDVAQLSAVPETQLIRIIRMTATVGFLREPRAGYVAHTPISAQFISRTSYRDAAMFLAEHATSAAIQMTSNTHRLQDAAGSANLKGNGQQGQTTVERSPRFERQWAAYLKHVGDESHNAGVTEVLSRLDWSNLLDNAQVVEACAFSPELSTTLADLHPGLHFVVQVDPSLASTFRKGPNPPLTRNGGVDGDLALGLRSDCTSSRITIESRLPGTPQTVRDAAVYILYKPPSSSRLFSSQPGAAPGCFRTWITTELKAHIGVLSAGDGTLIISTGPVLPEPGTVNAEIEAVARLRDLSSFQLFNEHEIEMLELVELVNSVGDGSGKLVVVNQLRSRKKVIVALCVKYRPVFNERQEASGWW